MCELFIRKIFKSLKLLASSLVLSLVHVTLLVVIFLLVVILANFVLLLSAVLLRTLPERFLSIVLPFLGAQILVGGLVCVLALSVIDLSALSFLLFRRNLVDPLWTVCNFPYFLLLIWVLMLFGWVLMRGVDILVIQSREKSLHKNWLNLLLLLLFLSSGFSALRPLFLAWRGLSLLLLLLLSNLHQLLLLLLKSLKFLDLLLLFG